MLICNYLYRYLRRYQNYIVYFESFSLFVSQVRCFIIDINIAGRKKNVQKLFMPIYAYYVNHIYLCDTHK